MIHLWGTCGEKRGEFPRSSEKVAGDVFQAVSLTHDPAYAAKEGTKGFYFYITDGPSGTNCRVFDRGCRVFSTKV